MKLFQQTESGKFYKLKLQRPRGLSVYVETDADGKPLMTVRKWSVGKLPSERTQVIRERSKLIEVKRAKEVISNYGH